MENNNNDLNNQPKSMRTFLIIWVGQVISIVGSGLTGFAFGVWIFNTTGQATPFALTALFGILPRILISPLAGSVADRYNRRKILIIADTGAALVTFVFALLLLGNNLEIWHVYVGVVISSTFGAFQDPAYRASITMMVPKKDLARAGGMGQMGQAISALLTPVLAGYLFVKLGLRGVIWIDFVTYFFAVGALLFVHIPQPKITEEDSKTKGSVRKDAVFGWNYLRERTGLFLLMWYVSLLNFLLNISTVMLVPLVLSVGGPDVLGYIQGGFGVGMLLGGVIMSAWGGPKRKMGAMIGFIILASSGMLIAGLSPDPIYIGVGEFVLMFFIPIIQALLQATFQTKVAPEVQGRVFAIRGMIAQAIMPLAYILSGPLADNVFEPLMAEGGALASTFVGSALGTGPGRGIGLMFILSCLTMTAGSILAYAHPRIRNLEEEIPDAIPDEDEGEEETSTN